MFAIEYLGSLFPRWGLFATVEEAEAWLEAHVAERSSYRVIMIPVNETNAGEVTLPQAHVPASVYRSTYR